MSRRAQSKKKKTGSHRTWSMINSALLTLYTVLAAFFTYQMFRHHFLAFRHLNVILTGILVAIFVFGLLLLLSKKAKLGTAIVLLVFTLLSAAGLYVVQSTVQVAEKINKTASYSETEMRVVVAADSPISDVSELTTVQAPTKNDSENIQKLVNDIQQNKGVTLATETVDSYQHAYENVTGGSTQAMVLNGAYSSLLELTYPDYEEKLKTIYTYKITEKVAPEKQTQANANVLNLYISGIDTYGSISTVSRSDVNIIMTVNMDTHKVLLTTTPRDSYVQIPDGGGDQYDKLTHAGIYGVETSMKTLENLYGIDINYYARINFTSFLKLIDLIGGVEVYNDQAFSTSEYDFPVGKITLNSEKALRFVRERYSLTNGDADRGRNQQKVIAAIINKLASIDSIANFSNIVSGLQDSLQTNMSLETVMQFANNQLSSKNPFTVTSQDVTGTGSTGQLPSYAMPGASLYMMSLDQASVDAAKQAIRDVMEGK
ncbi:LCP family protein [Streptococcus ovis]|uniref:LCP family glycopolymer transferase CpsA n=1 Tax=Streptococcus ovis TaxID=82806 RepID=UPI00036D15C2|nr:LCP family protein [Streptococcus ovis]